jgi:hypothetical protein
MRIGVQLARNGDAIREMSRYHTAMRMPRWLTIAMMTVSGLALLAVAGWWWVTWPDRTATTFVELLQQDDYEQANGMVAHEARKDSLEGVVVYKITGSRASESVMPWSDLTPQPRSIADIAFSRRQFGITGRSRYHFLFSVERSRVIMDSVGFNFVEFEIAARRMKIFE